MYRCLIIDDEQDGRDVLSLLIADYCPGLSVIETSPTAKME